MLFTKEYGRVGYALQRMELENIATLPVNPAKVEELFADRPSPISDAVIVITIFELRTSAAARNGSIPGSALSRF